MELVVIGRGVMGQGLVQLFSETDKVKKVHWVARSSDSRLVEKTLLKQWKRKVEKKRITDIEMNSYLSKIVIGESFSCVANSEMVIEAVSEEMETKRLVFAKIARFVQPHTLVASNTSSLSITELSMLMPDPSCVVGIHFFNPATVMKLVEVVSGLTTSEETIGRSVELARVFGKEPVVVNEAPGFIVNRMLIPMINEAIGILAEGVASADDIDKAMKLGAGHPMGPLALADLIGNDVNLSIMQTLHNETGDSKYRAHPLLSKMVRANQLGRKTKQGFYTYR